MRIKLTICTSAALLLAVGLPPIGAATPPATPQGTITGRAFLNIPGTVVTDLTGNARFPDTPDAVHYLPYFEWNPDPTGDISIPANNAYGENYGAQIIGYFYPPVAGDYVFWVSADDGANLYLSTDTDPANKKLIAREAGWSNPRSWDTMGGGSVVEDKNSSTFTATQWATKDPAGGAKITLQANQPYYIEALMKEGGGGDNLAVAVQAPDGSIDPTLPIPGNRLSPISVAAAPTIVAQPRDVAAYSGGTADFNVGLDIPPGATLTSITWQKNGVDIPNSNSPTLSLPTTEADNNAKIKAIIITSAGTLTTTEATLTVATFSNEFAQGVVKFEAFTDITGTVVENLTTSEKYIAGTPDDVRLLSAIDTPNAYGDNYGVRISGFIIPPETGSYRFFLRSDDASEFWLSTDTNAANAVLIAEETGCCDAFKEPDDSLAPNFETSLPQELQAGRRYAFYALLKEGGGGDYVQVAARREGDTTPVGGLRPLSGAWIGANAKPNLGTPQITQQPTSLPRVIEGTTARLSVAGTVTPAAYNYPLLIQWQKGGVDIPGAMGPVLVLTNATSATSGVYRAVVSAPSGITENSAEATVTVVPDTFPPEPVVGAVKGTNNLYDVGITFDEPVDAAAGTQANYSISAGTITAFKYYPKSPGVVLTVSGLTAGSPYSVTVQNVADTKGNKITSVTKEFTAGNMAWGVVGASELGLGNGVVAVGDDGFDLYSDSMTEWASYDEATFVYEQVTGDFDKKARVEYQDASSQWARAGLIARDVTNFGVDRATQEGGTAGRYQKVHVNPVVTAMGTPGNNSWEGNRRLATGAATTSAGGGGTPLYPSAWVRLQRVGDLFTIYRSDDGVNWTQLGTTTFDEPMPATLYVGPEYAPENGNIPEDSGLRAMWLAKIRDYGDTAGNGGGGEGPLTFARTATGLTLSFTGSLQSADAITGPWTDMPGTSPQSVTFSGTRKFYRIKP